MNKNMENFRKKESNRNTKHSQRDSSRLEKVKDRISELKDKIEIKGKTEEILSNNSRTVKVICKTSPTPQKTKFENYGY
jgi:5-enolpyruvylshikimate-3-phosphate synthase